MKLLLDQGNSRLKWAIADGVDRLCAVGVVANDVDIAERITVIAGAMPAPVGSVHASSVASDEFNHALSDAVTRHLGLPTHFFQAEAEFEGLRSGYKEPQVLGVDRWLAMIGARSLVRNAVLVVDAGTAVTLDAVQGQGEHQGGLIVPGFRTQCIALGRQTTRVGYADALPVPGWGTDTPSAVANGVCASIAALIDRSLVELQQGVADTCTLVLTGGDSLLIRPFLRSPVVVDEHLVFRGMLARAGRTLPSRQPTDH